VNACVHTYTKPQTSSTRSRGLGWRIHESVEDTKLSTNKQHSLSLSATSLHPRTRTLSDMDALDKRLYTSHHAPTDEPDCVKLACHGCCWQSVARLSLLRYCTHTPHPCTILTAAHNIHTRPPAAQARLAYQRTLMNPYCTLVCADLVVARATTTKATVLSRSHAAGPASTSLVSDAETCLTRKTLRPLQRPVVAPVLAELALAATTIAAVLPSLEQTRFYSN